MISYNRALQILKSSKIKIKEENIKVKNSINRILSRDIYSKVNYPSGDNSALDGFAVRSSDTIGLNKKKPKKFKIIRSIAAGDNPKTNNLKRFNVVKIMTGGLIPKKLDSVIPIEKIYFSKNKEIKKSIILSSFVKKNENIRKKGSDFKKKEIIAKKGTIIQNSHILAFKSLGVETIFVKKKLNILFFSTGNEISDKVKIPNWKVRNSNTHYIQSLSSNFSFNFVYGGIIKDNQKNKFKNILKKKLIKKNIDLIITSGAVSAGEFDFIPSVINSFKISKKFKGVYMRPGKPILFAKFKKYNKVFFGLPGNPISTAACFRFFVYPFLRHIMSMKKEKSLQARLKSNFVKNVRFTRFVKSKLSTSKKGILEIKVLKGQESFKIRSFTKSNVWGVFPSGRSLFKKGDLITCFNSSFDNKIFFF